VDADTNKQLVIDAWRAFATREPDRVRAVFTPDAEWLAPAGNATALALDGTHHLVGRERIVRFITAGSARCSSPTCRSTSAACTPTVTP
jgi:uncharacterized protein